MPELIDGVMRVSTNEAADIMGCVKSTVYRRASLLGWKPHVKVSRDTGGPKNFMFCKSDVDAFVAGNNHLTAVQLPAKGNFGHEVRDLVKWADSLDEWPSDEEIESRVSERFKVRDIEGIIDERVFRFRDPKKALRQPAMRLLDRRGREYL